MPEVTVKGQGLTDKEKAVYLPILVKAVREDSRTAEHEARRILNEAGLDLHKDRISLMLEVARIKNHFAMATRFK